MGLSSLVIIMPILSKKGCFIPLGICTVVFVGFLIWVFTELPLLTATITSPDIVQHNEEFNLTIQTMNPHDGDVELDSIDLSTEFLEGFKVLHVDPKPKETFKIFGMRTYVFERKVAPGEELFVTFKLKGVMKGHFNGDVDVCNPNQDFQTLVADITVQ